MKNTLRALGLIILACLTVAAQAQQTQPASPAPPAGSAGIYKANAELMAALKAAAVPASGMTASPVALTDQYRINIVRRAN